MTFQIDDHGLVHGHGHGHSRGHRDGHPIHELIIQSHKMMLMMYETIFQCMRAVIPTHVQKNYAN